MRLSRRCISPVSALHISAASKIPSLWKNPNSKSAKSNKTMLNMSMKGHSDSSKTSKDQTKISASTRIPEGATSKRKDFSAAFQG